MTETYLPARSPRRRRSGARPGRWDRLARLSYRRRGMVLLAWAAGARPSRSVCRRVRGQRTPTARRCRARTPSRHRRLLNERFPAQSGDASKVVVRADNVNGSRGTESRSRRSSAELERMPHVADPSRIPTPPPRRPSRPDGRTLVARVYLDVTNPNDMPVEDTEKLLAAAQAAERDGLKIALGGRAVQLAEATAVRRPR